MRTLLLLTLLLPSPLLPAVAADDEGSSVVVLSFKWSKSRQAAAKAEAAGGTAPAAAMIPANKNFERTRRVNDPVGVRDPNEDTIDGRSAALEKSVREARSSKPSHVEGYEYRAKIQNAGPKAVEVIFWEYRFTESANPSNVARRQFLCGVKVKPKKDKELIAFSIAGPGDLISAASLSDNNTSELYRQEAVINRVEYADGSIWQRKGWSYGEVRASIKRVTETPWGAEMCRGL